MSKYITQPDFPPPFPAPTFVSTLLNLQLVAIADKFRADELSSNDKDDDNVVHEDWILHRAGRRARGGPYVAVHLR